MRTFQTIQGRSLVTRSFMYTVLKKHWTRGLGLSEGERLGSMQCMPCARMLSSGFFLGDITCSHWVPLSYLVLNTGFGRITVLRVLPPTNKLSFSQSTQVPACNMTTILLGNQLSGWHFTPWHHLSAGGSQMRTDFCPIFNPWRLSLWCLYL